MTNTSVQTGYAPVNGLELYYEIHGAGEPLVLLHGGFGLTSMFDDELLPRLAEKRQVIAVDLQGHGRTADIDRPLRLESMGDDVAGLINHLGLAKADVIGYSMGGGTAMRTAIQHPEIVRKLVIISIPFKRNGWYPGVLAGMEQINSSSAAFLQQTPMYQTYASVAPKPENFPMLCDKMGDMMRRDYDWTDEVAAMKMPVLILFGDADGVPPAHAAEFFGLLGGGQRDGSWDESGMSNSRLAILPGTTHYNIIDSPALAPAVISFLDAPMPESRKA
ncbi:MAG: alpha/beta hydrolase [Chloroflexi bacterium]|nr:alpha/beta hydrolase [Chloroflexota bacterium]